MTAIAAQPTEFFQENGYLHVPDLVTGPELVRLQRVTDQIIDFASVYRVPDKDYQYRTDPQTGEEMFYRVNNVKVRSVEFQALFGHPGLLNLFQDIMGPNFLMIDDALVVKLANSGTDFPWHRDAPAYAANAGGSLLVPGIDLDISNHDNGCLHVLPGSHRDAERDIQALVAEHGFDLPGAVAIESTPGAVVAHSGNTLHGSRPNFSSTTRRTIYVAAMNIDDYLESYEGTAELVLMQMRYMLRGIQLRRSLPYIADEKPFKWSGSREWRLDLADDDYVDWGLPAAPRRRPTTA